MNCSKYFFLFEEHEETTLLGPFSLDVTYLELVNDLTLKSKNFTADHTICYAVPGRSDTYSTIKSETEMRHMMILHEARNESVIISKIVPLNAASSVLRFLRYKHFNIS